MNVDSFASLARALCAAAPFGARSVDEFWRAHRAHTHAVESAFDRAALGGAHAASVGQAFIAGYRGALQRMFSALDREAATLCVTEASGAHPRAIRSSLSPSGEGGWTLDGAKRWASVGEGPVTLLVLARVGDHPDGRPSLRVARVPSDRAGVTLEPMPATPFVPDVFHASVSFESVSLQPEELLDGDGYARFVKPFRTVEDTHVFGALLGYLVATGRGAGWPSTAISSLFSALASLRSIAHDEPSDPCVHLALAGAIEHAQAVIASLEPHWPQVEEPRRAGWERDRLLLDVASKARAERAIAAARALGLRE
jgi:acyl-CoA dehydrogenase